MKVTVKPLPGLRQGAIRAVLPAMRKLRRDIPQAMLIHSYINRTGRLENSTETELNELTGVLIIRNIAPYAGYVERGTSKMNPRPFMLPALVRFFGKVES